MDIEAARADATRWTRDMEAVLHNQRGAEAFNNKDWNAAFTHWLASLHSAPSPSVMHNLQVLGAAVGNAELLERYRMTSTLLYTPPPTDKPVLAIYTGYSPPYTGKSVELKQVWGSELAAVRLAEALSHQYDVTVFCPCLNEETRHNGVQYLHLSYYGDFCKSRCVDVLIVSRYMHFFLEHECRAKQVVLWLHDKVPHYMWNSTALPALGRPFFVNMLKTLDKIVCVSKWQATEALPEFVGSQQLLKTCVIGNAINPAYFLEPVAQKVKARFIFCTDPSRGLPALLKLFHAVAERVPHATLHVYWTRSALPQTPPHPGVTFFDKVPQQELAQKMREAEIMAYPNEGHETYCMAALEAQAAGCVVVCRNFSGLAETVGDRGVLVDGAAVNEDWISRAVDACVELLTSDQKLTHLASKSRAWALEQTWEQRGAEWLDMLAKK
jgi:glycosyltransferase involved in cell wall biosynthesis